MNGFIKVNPWIYHLPPPVPEFGAGVTLVIGVNNFLIDCGAFDYSVSKFLIPALKAIKYDLKDIDYLLLTHTHPDNIGGIHKLKQLAPHIRIMTYGYQTDRLKNPSYYLLNAWSEFPDYAPPFRELKGILADGTVDPANRVFSDLRPIVSSGHTVDCVSWHHVKSNTLICGDAVQGAGTDETGVAFFTSLELYRNTLSDIIELAPENLLPGRDFRSAPSIVHGQENSVSVLEDSFKTGVLLEHNVKALSMAKENLSNKNIEFIGFSDNKWCELPQSQRKFDLVVMDPPRSGLSEKVINWLIETKQPEICFISCNPVTLVRDFSVLIKTGGYRLKKGRLYDFYPQTGHMESFWILKHEN